MDQIKVNLENLTDDERSQLMALVEKANKPKARRWKPKDDETCFFLAGDGSINEYTYGNLLTREKYYELGNAFKYKEEAEKESKRRKILANWKRLSVESGEDKNPWDGKEGHFYCYYDYDSKEIRCDWNVGEKQESVYFATAKSLFNAIKEIGEDNVKKYVLCVSD